MRAHYQFRFALVRLRKYACLMKFSDLNRDSLETIFSFLELPLALKLTCRSTRDAAPKRTKSYVGHALASVRLMKWACTCGMKLCKRTDIIAAREGCLEMLKWAATRTNNGDFHFDVQRTATKHGHIPVLAWVMPYLGNHSNEHAFRMACFHGQVNVMCWLQKKYPFQLTLGCMASAARGGHLAAVKWLHKRGCEYSGLATTGAAKEGHLHVLKWLYKQHGPSDWAPDLGTTDYICSGKWTPAVMYQAAEGGRLDVVEWLHANGCPASDGMCDQAAALGRLDILQWAYAHGALPTCNAAVANAARLGNLEILKWVHSLRPELGQIPVSIIQVVVDQYDQASYEESKKYKAIVEWALSENLVSSLWVADRFPYYFYTQRL